MSAYIEGLRRRDDDVTGGDAQTNVGPTKALELFQTRGIESPISGDMTTLLRAAAATFYIEGADH